MPKSKTPKKKLRNSKNRLINRLGKVMPKGTTRKGGKPWKLPDAKEVDQTIDKYFKNCKKNKDTPTLTGLAYILGVDRHTLVEYEGRDEYSASIKKAKLMCELFLEQKLIDGKGNAGQIFVAKCNYKWDDGSRNGVNIDLRGAKIDMAKYDFSKLESTEITDILLKRTNAQQLEQRIGAKDVSGEPSS